MLFVLKYELQQRILNGFFANALECRPKLEVEVFHANFPPKTWNSVDEQNRLCFLKKKYQALFM